MKDPIVEEVRKHRMEHTRQFGGDLVAICADLRAKQAASGRVAVRLPPRLIADRQKTLRSAGRAG